MLIYYPKGNYFSWELDAFAQTFGNLLKICNTAVRKCEMLLYLKISFFFFLFSVTAWATPASSRAQRRAVQEKEIDLAFSPTICYYFI